MIKKIVVIGPESTGKSTLCEQLADHYHTQWCPEFAREYLLQRGMDYHYDDLLHIAKGQLTLEDNYTKKVTAAFSTDDSEGTRIQKRIPRLFIDTDMYVMKVWAEFVFGKCHRYILDQIVERKYDLYLLCDIDLPWTKDELREYPDIESRRQLYNMYKDIMINQSVPWTNIDGSHSERLQKAILAVDRLD
jgi:NadR type nicotinamide-nucleotide adenylyltransferase